jgi:hypothetical protein
MIFILIVLSLHETVVSSRVRRHPVPEALQMHALIRYCVYISLPFSVLPAQAEFGSAGISPPITTGSATSRSTAS